MRAWADPAGYHPVRLNVKRQNRLLFTRGVGTLPESRREDRARSAAARRLYYKRTFPLANLRRPYGAEAGGAESQNSTKGKTATDKTNIYIFVLSVSERSDVSEIAIAPSATGDAHAESATIRTSSP